MALERYLLPPDAADWRPLAAYRQAGGYDSARARALRRSPARPSIEEVKALGPARARRRRDSAPGRSGASCRSPAARSRRYIACNGDESEPGTFKDRQILERNPHLLIEGLIITGHAIGARAAYVYLRGEYVTAFDTLVRAVEEARAARLLGDGHLGKSTRDVRRPRACAAPARTSAAKRPA